LVVKEVLRDGGPRYNILSNLGVPYSHVMFGGVNRPSGASSTSGMDEHFPRNARERSASG